MRCSLHPHIVAAVVGLLELHWDPGPALGVANTNYETYEVFCRIHKSRNIIPSIPQLFRGMPVLHTTIVFLKGVTHYTPSKTVSGLPTMQKPKRQTVQDMPFMLSEPLDDSSSDTKSFDEEDMYGSDPDVETDESLDHPSSKDDGSFSETDPIHIEIHNLTLMVRALSETMDAEIASIDEEADDGCSAACST
ncbi:hypothetical protein V8E53_000870 [Lactarius tabidus]